MKREGKCFRLHTDTRGLSLVELLVAMAILTIIGGAIMSFFTMSIRQSTRLDEDGSLHIETQNTWNQLRNTVQNTNAGIYTDGSTLILYSKEETAVTNADGTVDLRPVLIKTVFTLGNHQIIYNDYTRESVAETWSQAEIDKDQIFAAYVEDVSFRITDAAGNDLTGTTVDSEPHAVYVTFAYENGDRTANQEREVFLRNSIRWVPDESAEAGLF